MSQADEYPEVRPTVVEALLRIQPRMQSDNTVAFTDEEQAILQSATQAEVQAAHDIFAGELIQSLIDSGTLRHRTILDWSLRTVTAVAAVHGLLVGWWPQPRLEHAPLGDVLKVIPPEKAEKVLDVLIWGGLMPPRDSSPGDAEIDWERLEQEPSAESDSSTEQTD